MIFYFEETIIGNEYKIYYINGKIFSKNQIKINESVSIIFDKISKILGLEMFFLLILYKITKKKIFIIDVNPAPGFIYQMILENV